MLYYYVHEYFCEAGYVCDECPRITILFDCPVSAEERENGGT